MLKNEFKIIGSYNISLVDHSAFRNNTQPDFAQPGTGGHPAAALAPLTAGTTTA